MTVHQMGDDMEPMTDERTAVQRVEDTAFENRIKTLTAARKWNELRLLLAVYGSALDERART